MILNNKIAVVTGASTGIGQAVALELSKQGAFVFLIARARNRLEKTCKLIGGGSKKSKIITADLSNISSINQLIQQIKTYTKKVDILANIAGIWHGKDEVYAGKNFETFSQQVILDTFMVGTIAPTLLAHALIPLMPKNSKIINLSGTFENGAKGWIPYYASKRALEDLTVGLAQELKDKNIQVNGISPSDTATESYQKYFPQYIEDAVSPKIIAQQAVYLCSKEANNVTGQIFVVKKGKIPFPAFHY